MFSDTSNSEPPVTQRELVTINGYQIDFPFEPYTCQRNYMATVLCCLETGQNGMLESPTGTGKTLSLLCSSLAWLESAKTNWRHRRRLANTNVGNVGDKATTAVEERTSAHDYWDSVLSGGDRAAVEAGQTAAPRIIYASRTHSQLSQAMHELKRTSYGRRVQSCVIGSREQLCINQEVMIEPNNSLRTMMCRQKIANDACQFYTRSAKDRAAQKFSTEGVGVLDIEDLVKFGRGSKVCPYYTARNLRVTADIVFMPYNYLVDEKSRRRHGIDVAGAVLVFDEAHNLEKCCEDAASADITSLAVAMALEEVGQVAEILYKLESAAASLGAESANLSDIGVSLNDALLLKKAFIDLERNIVDIKLDGDSTSFPGDHILEIFQPVLNVLPKSGNIFDLMDACCLQLSKQRAGLRGHNLAEVVEVLRLVSPSVGMHRDTAWRQSLRKSYTVHIQREQRQPYSKTASGGGWGSSKNSDIRKFVKTESADAERPILRIGFWCFSAAFAMNSFRALGARCVIVTSGTLAPFPPLISELGLDFPHQISCGHVIDQSQVLLTTTTCGPDKIKLLSTYQNRDSTSYMRSLGNSLVNISRIVPNGMLVFFASYASMSRCVEFWRGEGIFDRLHSIKAVMTEPKNKTDFEAAIADYYARVLGSEHSPGGALFMGVCRGKVAEGIDFADANGRAVIITGLPYPPIADPKVIHKKAYLREQRKNNPLLPAPEVWYRNEASRAVNQAIGRVIRHRRDYG